MALEQRLAPRLQQRLVMTPALQLAIRLLQLNRLELEGVLQQEMVENPLLEEREQEVSSSSEAEALEQPPEQSEPEAEQEADKFEELNLESYFQDYYDSRPGSPRMHEEREGIPLENILAETPSMVDQLLWQLEMTDADDLEMEIGQAIVGNLNMEGYLRASLDEIAAMGPWHLERVESALARIQSLDPPGVAARYLKECLLLQLDYLELHDDLAYELVEEHLDKLTAHRYNDIAKSCGVAIDEVAHALEIIKRLNPKPGYLYATEPPRYITPDVSVIKDGDDYRIVLNEDGLPKLRISRFYRQMLRSRQELSKDAAEYLQTKLRSALWLIKSYGQRQRTITRVAESIVKHQRPFLEHGVAELRPLILRDVADDIEMHESTVSRVVNGKYMHTPQGIYEMKFFFHSALGHSSGSDVSSISVKGKIRKLIDSESRQKPLSDARIASELKNEGLQIARRTVAKYREEMGIPASKSRREIG